VELDAARRHEQMIVRRRHQHPPVRNRVAVLGHADRQRADARQYRSEVARRVAVHHDEHARRQRLRTALDDGEQALEPSCRCTNHDELELRHPG
jgi:hypothetical protein